MKITKSILGLLGIAAFFIACGGTDFKKTKGGAPYKIVGDKKGEKVVEGNIVKFHLTQKIGDSVLMTTYGQFPRFERVTTATAEYDMRNTIMDVLMNARKGDSIYVTMSMDSFIKRDPSIVEKTPFRKGDEIVSTLRILEVYRTPAEAEADIQKENMDAFNKDPRIQEQLKKDDKAIMDYLNAKGIKAEKTPWGAYVQILTPGQGAAPKSGQYAHVRYTGMDLNGKEFDSNNKPGAPLYPLQIGAGGSIMGFEDGVRQLPKGSKARIYIPSVLGYGEQGSPPAIEPNLNLMFEVEVVDITDTPPEPTQPPMPNQ